MKGVFIKLHSQLKIGKAIRGVGRKEVLMNFSKAGAETANSKLEILCWRLAGAGRGAAAEGSLRLPSGHASQAALAWGRGRVDPGLSEHLQKSVVVILKRPLFLEMR